MLWPKLNSFISYQSLKSYCESRKDDEAFGFDFGNGLRKSKFVAFQCYAMIQRIKGEPVPNSNIISTFNSETKGEKGNSDTRTMELVWAYGKSLLSNCAGIQPALRAQPKIPSRDMETYRNLISTLTRKGISVTGMTKAVIDYQPEILRMCNTMYEEWDRWQAETFAQEAQTLISDPGSSRDLKKLRKLQKDRLDGTGLFKAKTASSAGKFLLYPKAKDGLPLIVFSPAADANISADVKSKVEMFKSGVKSVYYSGTWHQSGNRKSITLACQSNPPAENLVSVALQSIDIVRSITIR